MLRNDPHILERVRERNVLDAARGINRCNIPAVTGRDALADQVISARRVNECACCRIRVLRQIPAVVNLKDLVNAVTERHQRVVVIWTRNAAQIGIAVLISIAVVTAVRTLLNTAADSAFAGHSAGRNHAAVDSNITVQHQFTLRVGHNDVAVNNEFTVAAAERQLLVVAEDIAADGVAVACKDFLIQLSCNKFCEEGRTRRFNPGGLRIRIVQDRIALFNDQRVALVRDIHAAAVQVNRSVGCFGSFAVIGITLANIDVSAVALSSQDAVHINIVGILVERIAVEAVHLGNKAVA